MRLFTKGLLSLGLGLLVTACGPRQYYIPVDNKLGDAKPLNKNDIIQVLAPYNLPELTKKTRENGKDWTEYLKAAMYEISAKDYTEERLSAIGFYVINKTDHIQVNSHPTVVALVYSAHDVSKDHDLVAISQSPAMTDEYGQPTFWNTDTEVIPIEQIYLRVKLIRPIGEDNPLFQCNQSKEYPQLGVCLAPEHPENYPYQTISDDYGTMDTSSKSPAYIENHLTTGVLYNYPNLLGKKRVYLYTQPLPQVFKVVNDPPEKKK